MTGSGYSACLNIFWQIKHISGYSSLYHNTIKYPAYAVHKHTMWTHRLWSVWHKASSIKTIFTMPPHKMWSIGTQLEIAFVCAISRHLINNKSRCAAVHRTSHKSTLIMTVDLDAIFIFAKTFDEIGSVLFPSIRIFFQLFNDILLFKLFFPTNK